MHLEPRVFGVFALAAVARLRVVRARIGNATIVPGTCRKPAGFRLVYPYLGAVANRRFMSSHTKHADLRSRELPNAAMTWRSPLLYSAAFTAFGIAYQVLGGGLLDPGV